MCKHYSNWVKPSLQKLTYISLLELQFCANPSANLLQNVIYLLFCLFLHVATSRVAICGVTNSRKDHEGTLPLHSAERFFSGLYLNVLTEAC